MCCFNYNKGKNPIISVSNWRNIYSSNLSREAILKHIQTTVIQRTGPRLQKMKTTNMDTISHRKQFPVTLLCSL